MLLVQHQERWRQEEPRQSVITAFRALLSTGLEDELLPELCLPWHFVSLAPAEHLQPELGVGNPPASAHLWDAILGFPLSSLPSAAQMSAAAAGGRRAMCAGSLGQDHTLTFAGKSCCLCMTNKCGSRIFRRGYSLKIKIVPARDLKKLQRGRTTEFCSFFESAIKAKRNVFFKGRIYTRT